ncbi:MAG: NAD(P)/FAD-dependent oxidoreductase [Dehalococcoidia bacterium]|nr:NAD(P)/FAD-dependent oxidoreductase [Dehalococcoidia bacterium]
MTSINTEVAIIGAGPSGSIAAHQLAAAGLDVILLDRAKFPRDKPCGGGVTVRCERILPFSIDPVIEDVITDADIRIRDESSVLQTSGSVLTYMTQRARLDAFLADKAQEVGTKFRDGEQVTDILSKAGDGFVVKTRSGTEIQARVLLGADGANGITGNRLGFDSHSEGAVALEGNVYFPDGVPSQFEHKVSRNFGSLTQGYGWIFPKGDHVNIGVGGSRLSGGKRLKAAMFKLAEIYGIDYDSITEIKGHHLPMRRPGSAISIDGSALLGDAAGLVDPLSGEGIFAALRSGMAVAPVVEQYLSSEVDSLAGYQFELQKELLPEIETSEALMQIFHTYPRPFVWMLQHVGLFWIGAIELIRGDSTYLDLTNKFGKIGRSLLMPAAWLGDKISARRRA